MNCTQKLLEFQAKMDPKNANFGVFTCIGLSANLAEYSAEHYRPFLAEYSAEYSVSVVHYTGEIKKAK